MWEVIPELQPLPGLVWLCENLVFGNRCGVPATWILVTEFRASIKEG